ncbi:TonB-dependent siderophore receptor [Microbulbifer thermotolerans]|uniref:TonB-dependent siderophore receptor n=1 Tax=Microbulbifer thermotolerans TaxID=252514 RepID=UPI00224B8BA9|nr:TonB-dependent siderophore receptor [Microbulbifer thermotolerans]MCX2840601.1 TonB-dependent siderophore receptor [Microbulbifer thermotolerans]
MACKIGLSAQPTLLAIALSLTHTGTLAQEDQAIETVEVTGEVSESYLTGEMDTATGLGLSSLETPQSVSVINRTQLDDFELNSLNDALLAVPGIQVESVETDRTYYSSRGFDVTNFQVDGVGVPATYGNLDGETDMALYDRVEIVRGASGLMSGAGNPSATVNMVRKRPTEDFQLSIDAVAGSWDKARLEADASGTLTEGLRGRLVVAKEERESYLDDYAMDKTLIYGVVEKDLGQSTVLTLGSSYQTSNADSPLWGALPMHYTDGTPTDYNVSTTTSADWAYWDNTEADVFAELKHTFANGWEAKAYYTHAEIEGDSELLYMFGTPDPETEEGLYGYPSAYTLDETRDQFDLRVSGSYSFAGREHDLLFGYNWAKGSVEELSLYDGELGFPAIGDFSQWDGSGIARPVFDDNPSGSDFEDKQSAYFAATRVHLMDNLSLIGGARVVDWKSVGEGYGTSKVTEESGKVLPYAGLIYRIGDNYSLYISRTETFMPQDDLTADLTYMDPTEGVNNEVGAKGEFFDGKLQASIAYYQTEQKNVAESAGEVTDPLTGGPVQVYEGVDYDSEGVDLALSGQLAPGLQVDFSYAYVEIDDQNGELDRAYIPQQMVRLFASYRPQVMENLKLGAGLNWQDDIERTTSDGYTVQQDAYATVRAFASYRVNKNLEISLNANNLTDEKYISSLYWDQAFYAAPRNFSASVSWRY